MKLWGSLLIVGAVVGAVPAAFGQEWQPRAQEWPPRKSEVRSARKARKVRDYSWTFIDAPEQREIKVHDIVTVIVDDKSEATINSRFNRTKNTNLKAELKEFVRINEADNLENAAKNEPTIDAQSTSRLNSTGQVTDQEGMRFHIAATVVDVLPNGILVLEARKSIRSNRDLWEYSLTGEVRSIDVTRNNTVLSEQIANLHIEKHQRGKVYSSTKRPWGVVLYDLLSPF